MGYWIRMYRASLKIAIASMLQYRMEILIWAVWGFVAPLISLAVWNAAAIAKGGTISNGVGATFKQADFASYFLVSMIFNHIMMSWDAFEFAYRVRDGNLSPRLLKPIHPIHGDASQNIAFKVTTSVMLLPIWIGMFLILKPTPPAHWYDPVLAIPALMLGAVMRYVFQYCLAMVAFWTTRVEAINQLYNSLDGFLAGRFAPLALLPGWLGTIAFFSPFRYMGAFPVELALGRVPVNQILSGYGLQVFWAVAGLGLLRLMWANGIKQYSAVGA